MKSEIKTILVPTDFTDISKNALKVAAKMAQRHEAKLIVSHTVQSYYVIGRGGKQVIGSEVVQDSINLASAKLEKLKNSFQEKYNLTVETRISSENIVETINDLVATDQLDLVVMGTAGRQKMKQFLLGSNSYNVLLHANCSVLLIPEKFKKTSFKKVLFPVRVEQQLDHKADLSVLLAHKNNGAIMLLGVGAVDEMLNIKQAYVEMKKNLMFKSANYHSEFQLSYDNAELISKAAIDKKCDIIMLANKDENSWKSFMADNFFKKMINGSDIPLFIVKSKCKKIKIKNKKEHTIGYDLTMQIPG